MSITSQEMERIREYTDAQLAEYHDLVKQRWEDAGPIMAPRWDERRRYAADEAKRRYEGSPTNRIPHSGARKTCIARRCTYEEARSIAQAYNATHEPGWQSRKAEFDSE